MKQSSPYTAQDFLKDTNVSRETFERLQQYEANLRAWNARQNLVSKGSLEGVWRRHFLDSAQAYPLLGDYEGALVDVGSGAGFPGLVLSIMGAKNVHLVESEQKKAAFLVETAHLCGSDAVVHPIRAEALKGVSAGIITARAVAPLDRLLELTFPLFEPRTRGIFLKGLNVVGELTEAHKKWKITTDRVPSRSDPSGTVIIVREVNRVEPD